jgi:hypothetical protein
MTSCGAIQRKLGEYADGELAGAARLRISQHLAGCTACGAALREIRDIGDLMRAETAVVEQPEFAGLAAGVISRVRAEEAQSWRGLLRRATGDWHWAIVGSGSVVASLVTILMVGAICQFGFSQHNDESLASLLENLRKPAGRTIVVATPIGAEDVRVLLQVDGPAMADASTPLTLPAGFSSPTELELAFALSEALVRPDGRVGDLGSMPSPARQQTEAILSQQLRSTPGATWSARPVRVERIGLMMTTNVFAKAL